MRGTEIVPIWEDTNPLFYWNFKDDIPNWKKRRLIDEEYHRLVGTGCRIRISDESDEWFLPDEDGFCIICRKDFQGDGLYCSDDCEKQDYRKDAAKIVNDSPACEVCGKKIVDEWASRILEEKFPHRKIKHHISYADDKTKLVCAQCHSKIHHSNDDELSKLRPIDKPSDIKKTPKKKKEKPPVPVRIMVHCEKCGTTFDSAFRTTCPKCRTYFK